jgi:hypothetical protein
MTGKMKEAMLGSLLEEKWECRKAEKKEKW